MVRRYGLVIDLERCIGCQTCTVACKAEHGIEIGSGIRVETIGGPHQDTPGGIYPNLSMHYLPIPCMHCDEPPCFDACPSGAISKRLDGIVLIDEEKCDGCQMCMSACPYEALIFDSDRSIARKCNLCYERLDEGFEPFCVLCCGVDAISYGDILDPASEVSKLVSRRNAYPLKPDRGTGPAIWYCAPQPPRRL